MYASQWKWPLIIKTCAENSRVFSSTFIICLSVYSMHVDCQSPSEHEPQTQWWINVAPPSAVLAQHQTKQWSAAFIGNAWLLLYSVEFEASLPNFTINRQLWHCYYKLWCTMSTSYWRIGLHGGKRLVDSMAGWLNCYFTDFPLIKPPPETEFFFKTAHKNLMLYWWKRTPR